MKRVLVLLTLVLALAGIVSAQSTSRQTVVISKDASLPGFNPVNIYTVYKYNPAGADFLYEGKRYNFNCVPAAVIPWENTTAILLETPDPYSIGMEYHALLEVANDSPILKAIGPVLENGEVKPPLVEYRIVARVVGYVNEMLYLSEF
ncbi:hypothetical protein LQZ19_09525 [Treponema primitia]|uniref:hypothetical protein n=1 Tax=Treponema primitia TaxID=88058 RepID=UPI0039812007